MSDFTVLPDFVFEETVEYKTLVSEFESGIEQRRRKWENPLRKWRLRFTSRIKADMELVRDFFKVRYGAFGVFTWTNPNDAAEYTVRFAEDSFKYVMKAHEVYDFEFDFIEVK
jgi:phage-related protein